jgi:hypothetical protein
LWNYICIRDWELYLKLKYILRVGYLNKSEWNQYSWRRGCDRKLVQYFTKVKI